MIDLEPMWLALARYQPYAEANGHGESWWEMLKKRDFESAMDAYDVADSVTVLAIANGWPSIAKTRHWDARTAVRAVPWAIDQFDNRDFEIAQETAVYVIGLIERAIKEREHVSP